MFHHTIEIAQFDKDHNQTTNSYGIGLSICKQIVAYQKGDILVESKEGLGSVFKVILKMED